MELCVVDGQMFSSAIPQLYAATHRRWPSSKALFPAKLAARLQQVNFVADRAHGCPGLKQTRLKGLWMLS